MPAYNAAPFIGEAIQSILDQTLQDFELLVVDDGSTDDTPRIVKSFGDPRIRLLRNEGGVRLSGATNTALAATRAELVAHHDADDVSHPRRFELELAYLRRHPEVALVGAQTVVIGPKGEYRYVFDQPRTRHGIRWALLFGGAFVHPTIMYRRAIVWDRLGGYDQRFSRNADYDLASRVTIGNPVANLRQRLLRKRLHPASITHMPSAAVGLLSRMDTIRSNLSWILGVDDPPREWIELLRGKLAAKDERAFNACVDLVDQLLVRYLARFPESRPSADLWRTVARRYLDLAYRYATANSRKPYREWRNLLSHVPGGCSELPPAILFCIARLAARRIGSNSFG